MADKNPSLSPEQLADRVIAESNQDSPEASAAWASSADLSADLAAEIDPALEMLLDIPIELSVELGSAHMAIHELLQLVDGSIVELDKLAGEPLDIRANGRLIARGEVVVVDDKIGVRVTDVVNPRDRITGAKGG
ncbi:MAG: flagellar motor switch protein FliN [Nitrospirae bacterium CG18_big_fil_WC_8_21_14_2_50_70_55]|nr:flagellar motor switch protein FliN [Deltaproteobacteria bacterium]OIP62819.1 MAG: flagellar motor switch protein FliN [Nitrospirae bacterium CG2_30_70_394]PIQ03486.1 MAG: flagellar motor switch protein FliN [Nitrospirae bacterium CG18_big_fil_WC_8_21_14_2_50_70_55]PIU77565.1 MAG: flagellar motor switch protein FliN [Nitrospirae bacterium CG06_land_8_20_14_3_00_70_43]PIW82307.1 MAG: flagellar motor switch protein FliN [Nitrospirae bacterium CG_4_8_14_3_um_filter_70_85]PIX82682.1 MAG: flagel